MHFLNELPFFRYDLEAGRPVLSDYLARIKSDLSPHYEDAHDIMEKLKAVLKKQREAQA